MKFFSGFCFQNEEKLFENYLEYNDFSVSGFSYGAIKAFKYTLVHKERIDKLQLFSPAFFQNRSDKFKQLQLEGFKKNRDRYIQNFLTRATFPTKADIREYIYQGKLEELEELIGYIWDREALDKLNRRGVDIEVYLGEKDKITDTKSASKFFSNYADIYFMKNRGHLLI